MTAQIQKWGVVFDCDSTLSFIEGIDELARAAGQFAAVEALTQQAMAGEIPLEAVYEKRLQLIQPQQQQMLQLAEHYLQTLLPDAVASVKRLQEAGLEVAIVSGGLWPALIPLAVHLQIPTLFAVPIEFDVAGRYRTVPAHPLCTAMGKAEILRLWRAEKRFTRLWMIGDGMSDAAAKAENAATDFLAFTGVVAREKVITQADGIASSLTQAVDEILRLFHLMKQ